MHTLFVLVASIQLPPKQYGSFEIRFQAPVSLSTWSHCPHCRFCLTHARAQWGKFSKRPDSGIIQINRDTGATRAVAWADAGRPSIGGR